jgi:hypothetical protein
MANSRRQRCAQINFKTEDGGQSRTEHDGSDSYEVTRRGIYFHASNLVSHRRRVLIERIYGFIDKSDGSRRSLPRRLGPHH